MKRVLNIGIGGRSFVINEDAYHRLDSYLESFKKKMQMGYQTKEVMDDLEMRIAELLEESMQSKQEVVTLEMINKIVFQLGMPDGSEEDNNSSYNYSSGAGSYIPPITKKLYRDSDNSVLGGVCGGLAAFFNMEIMLVRLLFVVAFIAGSVGFWVYIILWIIVPLAKTPAQKCEMRGVPATAENMRKFTRYGNC